MAIVALRWRALDAAGRHGRIGWWAGKLLRLLGIEVVADGTVRNGAVLLLANHVSWLDILVIHASCPRARFVSKADVRAWPLLGWLVGAVGTLFIERERKRDALRVVHQVAAALDGGDVVAVFPEGTTGDGQTVLPFHANLLQAAISTNVPVQALALRYADAVQRFSPVVAWLGDTTLVDSVWTIARARDLRVHVAVLPPQGSRHADRRALAALVRSAIAAELHRDHNAAEEPR